MKNSIPSTKVFIYSIPRETATKVSDFVNDSSGKRMRKTKIGKTRDTFSAFYSPAIGGYKNGLSYKPWIDPVSGKQNQDSDGKPLTLQDREEQRWNLPKGFLTNRPWTLSQSQSWKAANPNSPTTTYYDTASWKLNDGCTVFDLSKFEDAMGYYVALDSKLIANSEQELRAGKWPKATHYIALEDEEEQIKYARNQQKTKAYACLHDKVMSTQTKLEMCQLLELSSLRTALNEDTVHNLLFSYIDRSTFAPGSNIEKFLQLFELLKTADGRREFNARLTLSKAVDSRVVYEKQGSYKWNRASGVLVIGETPSEAVDFILNPKKAALVEELLEEIKAKSV